MVHYYFYAATIETATKIIKVSGITNSEIGKYDETPRETFKSTIETLSKKFECAAHEIQTTAFNKL